jgi:hypothetical protein
MGLTNFDQVAAPDGFIGPQSGTSDLQGTVLAAIDLTADVTLTVAQAKATRLEVSKGSASKVIIVPTGLAGKLYVVVNNDAALAAGIKVAGGTAITVAATKTAIVQVNSAGTEVTRISADV